MCGRVEAQREFQFTISRTAFMFAIGCSAAQGTCGCVGAPGCHIYICPGQLRKAIVSSRLANSITAIHYDLHINYNLNNYNLKRHPGSFRVVRSLQNPGSAAVFLFFILAIISYRAISTPS